MFDASHSISFLAGPDKKKQKTHESDATLYL